MSSRRARYERQASNAHLAAARVAGASSAAAAEEAIAAVEAGVPPDLADTIADLTQRIETLEAEP